MQRRSLGTAGLKVSPWRLGMRSRRGPRRRSRILVKFVVGWFAEQAFGAGRGLLGTSDAPASEEAPARCERRFISDGPVVRSRETRKKVLDLLNIVTGAGAGVSAAATAHGALPVQPAAA